jgi:hypothetical protein
MERLAWLEILDRHGDVSSHHPVLAWPLKIGRAYTNDIVLDDPHIAAHHVEIRPAEDGSYHAVDLGSLNGILNKNSKLKHAEALVSADDVLRIGQTQIRIRPLNYAVAAETPVPQSAWLRTWRGLLLGVALYASTSLLSSWLDFDRSESYNLIFKSFFQDILFVLAWAGMWTLISRVHTGRANFVAHAAVAYLGFWLAFFLANTAGYAGFMFDADWMQTLFNLLVIPAMILFFYQHMRLISRASRTRLVVIVTLVTVGLSAIYVINDKLSNDNNMDSMNYLSTIGPPSMLLVKGISKEEFIKRVGEMKVKLDD